jgi:hypothetical protein
VRDKTLAAPSRALSLYWMQECASLCQGVPALPVVIRLLSPFSRAIGGHAKYGEAACKCLVSSSTDPSLPADEAEKLRSALGTTLSAVTDPAHCLLLIETISRHVVNPKVAVPLLEFVLHAYLTSVPFHPSKGSSIEAAALSWTPRSLPSDKQNEFAMHDVAAAQVCSAALTMTMALERQRIVAPTAQGPTASQWATTFAGPALLVVRGFCPDEKRPFDWVALWLWCLSACVSPFQKKLHQDAEAPLSDWITGLDEIVDGYVKLPSLMGDRLVLAAAAVAFYAVICISGDRDLKHSGLGHRLQQLIKRSQGVRGAEAFAKYVATLSAEKRPVLRDFSIAIVQFLFPMSSYLMGVIRKGQ